MIFSRLKNRRHRKVANAKKRKYIPYIWLFWYNGLSVSNMNHKSQVLDGKSAYRMAWYRGRMANDRRGFAGWDIDRHRFFVSTRPTRYPNTPKRSRFRRENWERNHGYGPRELPRLHISMLK